MPADKRAHGVEERRGQCARRWEVADLDGVPQGEKPAEQVADTDLRFRLGEPLPRDLHVEMDVAVAAAYGWDDLDLGHGFHETAQGVRYTISESGIVVICDQQDVYSRQESTVLRAG